MSGYTVSADEARLWGKAGAIWKPSSVDLAHTVVQQAEQIAAVLALHRLVVVVGSDGVDYPICDDDEQTWPCETARALGVES